MLRMLFGRFVAVLTFSALAVPFASAQAGGASGAVAITVVDPTGSVGGGCGARTT